MHHSKPASRYFLLAAAFCFSAASMAMAAPEKPGEIRVYIGTYDKPTTHGIYQMRLDPATGALSAPELAGEMINPSWVTLSPNHKFLYACSEYGLKSGSAIAAFAIEKDGKLTALNEQPMAGGPCYASLDSTGKNLFAASYGSGVVEVFQVGADGKLSPPTCTDQHPGVGTKPGPHAHCIDADPGNHFVLSCDAGIDKVFVYRFDPAKGLLTANDPPFAALPPHAAPRHLAFSPDGKFVYTIQEAASTVTAFTYDAEHGVLHEIQSISTLPAGFLGKDLSTAELLMHPSGKFLYGSNRGHDSIVAYRVEPKTGKLELIGHTPSGGKVPRGMGIDPTGQWLIAGNQNSDSIVEFHIDQKTGELKATGTKFALGSPVCFKFMEVK
ncbi:MAG TPA: lactonase family protein [Tepidisphaeraceae bacterium]|jgi:6-phosphogluconolactonase|nr:lactonase family protein [Tepidisphaeraceae bacterium]